VSPEKIRFNLDGGGTSAAAIINIGRVNVNNQMGVHPNQMLQSTQSDLLIPPQSGGSFVMTSAGSSAAYRNQSQLSVPVH
jgi:hypothetical protein